MRTYHNSQRILLVVSFAFFLAVVSWTAVKAAPASQEAFSCADVSDIPQNECEALVALYNSTNGPGWFYHTGWLSTNTPCSWLGILCQDGHVSTLGLGGRGLSGQIPPELGNLMNLQNLYLSDQYELTGLSPDKSYFVRVRTYTPANENNQNDLWSDYSEVVPVPNLIANPGFELGEQPWAFYTDGQGYFNTDSRAYTGNAAGHVVIDQPEKNTQLFQTGFAVEPQTRYRLSFAAYSSSGHDLSLYLQQHSSPYQNYGLQNFRFNLTQRWQRFTVEFTTRNLASATTNTRLRFRFSPYGTAADQYWIDDVTLVKLPPSVSAAALPGAGEVVGMVQGLAGIATVKLVDLETGGSVYQTTIATDAVGAFRFDQVPMGTYELRVEPPVGYLAPEPVQLLVSEEPNEEFVFVVEVATNPVYLPLISQ